MQREFPSEKSRFIIRNIFLVNIIKGSTEKLFSAENMFSVYFSSADLHRVRN